MSYTASVLRLVDGAWAGDDLDLADVEDFDALIELLREHRPDDATSVLFVDEDDEYLLVVRSTGERDPHVFVSDRRVLDAPTIAARLLGSELGGPAGEDEEEGNRPEVEPAGEADLLADLGVSANALVTLCAEKGLLPADVTYEVCDRLGCGDIFETLRGL